MDNGTIIKSLSGFYYVANGGETARCRARGRFRHENIIPLVGDRVSVTMTSKGEGVVDQILPRRNYFSRPPVANVDHMVLIVSEAIPVSDPYVIDCMTAAAEHSGVEAVICINKCDLIDSGRLYDIYSRSGFKTIKVSAETGMGMEELLETIEGKISVFSGNSGVGKSSILNRLCPHLELKTGEVSEKLGRGRHTTRHVELMDIGSGTYIADTPGFSSFDVEGADLTDVSQLQYAFHDFSPYLHQCRYTGCSHTKEAGCAVLEAISEGAIQRSRHNSYVRLYKQLEQYKPWKNK